MAVYRAAAFYGILNIVAATGIVFANKAVFSVFKFHYMYTLTLVHTTCTIGGMLVFAKIGMFEKKKLPFTKLVPLAAAYVGYIVLSNWNLQINTVSFYQISKIAVAPAVLLIEAVFLRKPATKSVTASILLVCVGVGLATVSDFQLGMSFLGLLVGLGHVLSTTLYLVWVGTKQRELSAGSMQLLDQYCPIAAVMLALLVPLCEPIGWTSHAPETLLGYEFTPWATAAILVSAVLGLVVSLSTFLFIGATSSLTYNVVGHVKTFLVLGGGFVFFNEQMPAKKLAGIGIAVLGIVWYTHLKMAPQPGKEARREASPSIETPLLRSTSAPAEKRKNSGGALDDHVQVRVDARGLDDLEHSSSLIGARR